MARSIGERANSILIRGMQALPATPAKDEPKTWSPAPEFRKVSKDIGGAGWLVKWAENAPFHAAGRDSAAKTH
nr:hypothetical protein [uncultured Dongia sp.]